MSNFISVTEVQYNESLLLNLDNVVAVQESSGTVYTNTVHGEGSGMFRFDQENMQKIVASIELINQGILPEREGV